MAVVEVVVVTKSSPNNIVFNLLFNTFFFQRNTGKRKLGFGARSNLFYIVRTVNALCILLSIDVYLRKSEKNGLDQGCHKKRLSVHQFEGC